MNAVTKARETRSLYMMILLFGYQDVCESCSGFEIVGCSQTVGSSIYRAPAIILLCMLGSIDAQLYSKEHYHIQTLQRKTFPMKDTEARS